MNKQKSIYFGLVIACVCLMWCFSGFFVAGGAVLADTTDPDTTDPVTQYTIYFLDSNLNSNKEHSPLFDPVTISSTNFPYTIPYTPTKTGYTFGYWGLNGSALSVDTNGNFILKSTDIEGITGNEIRVYAYWDLIEYKITFQYTGYEYGAPSDPTGFDAIDDVVTVETDIALTKTVGGVETYKTEYQAKCIGHEFVGWFSDENYTTPLTKLDNVTGDVVLYGKFKKLDYYITFADETLGLDKISFCAGLDYPYDYTDSIGVVHKGVLKDANGQDLKPTKSGYTFDGWYTSPDCNGASKLSRFQPLSSSVTLYAKWVKKPNQIWLYASLGGCVLIAGGFVWWYFASKRKLMG